MQTLVGAAFAGVAFTVNTSLWLQGTICFFWLLAFSSATHDVVADGFYMMGLNQHDQAFSLVFVLLSIVFLWSSERVD